MIENLAALEALDRHGTTSAAGTALRVSQSAVSKRIAVLEARLGYELVERVGRRIEPTAAGRRLLATVRPLLGELREALASGRDERPEPFTVSLGVSESILSSWGPGLLREAMAAIPCLDLAIHAHRSPVVVDRVRSGEYMLGLCAGIAETAPDLSVLTVAREPMVLIPSGLRRIRIRRGTPVITIEESAATWSSIHRGLRSTGIDIEATVESFTAIARMAIAGLGHGLVPRGVAVALGLDLSQFQALAGGRITRPISLVGRKSLLARSPVADFVDRVQTLAAAACGPPPRPTG